MRAQTLEIAQGLDASTLPVPGADVAEARALLAWMEEQHFVFLGYRYYRLRRGKQSDTLVRDPASGLGILRTSRARDSGASSAAETGSWSAEPGSVPRSDAQPARFFRWISRIETAAGVMPGTRDAWPSVAGRTAARFCRASFDNPPRPA